ncbi:hypothetical protein KQI84_04545 [bacterium]|nr:hypothetical protein [bacterium]
MADYPQGQETWANYRSERERIPDGGIETFILLLIFMAILGAIAGALVLFFTLGRLLGAPSLHTGEIMTLREAYWLLGGFAGGGALVGMLLVVRNWDWRRTLDLLEKEDKS